MNISEFVALSSSDDRWHGVTRLPWDDEAFSRRMLREHLSQAHDGASRRAAAIERQVNWIDGRVLGGVPSRVLDLGCGPGLYGALLAEMGHTHTGIDISPASIAYAREHAASDRERYALGDMTSVELPGDQDLVMLIHGEFNVLPRGEAAPLLRRIRDALCPGGHVLLEVHHQSAVEAMGERPRTWMSMQSGLFGDAPHVRFDESRWSEESQTACNLNWVIDSATSEVFRYGTLTQGYERQEYVALLNVAGFSAIEFAGSLDGGDGDTNYLVLLATR